MNITNEEIEKIIKIQGRINNSKYHLCISTDLENEYKWALFLKFPDTKDYFSRFNYPILSSNTDRLDYLIEYLDKHNGFEIRW